MAQCDAHKFVDDTTLSEYIQQNMLSNMCQYVLEVLCWSQTNNMNINWCKTKEMLIGPVAKQLIPQLIVQGNIIQRVNSFKLLGVCIDNNLKWDSHVNAICSKASSRLYFLKLLKRSSVSKNDLLHFYVSFIRPVLEYACPVWHTSLTVEQTNRIEHIQRRTLLIIYGVKDYTAICNTLELPTLFERRESLSKSFFKSILEVNSCLHYLLPDSRNINIISKLRHANLYIPPTAKTSRYKHSFLPYSLDNYQ
jgi:hypothetical protein